MRPHRGSPHSEVPYPAGQRSGSDVLVLCYHSISPALPARFNVTPQAFERQVRSLARRGYRGVTFRDAVLGPRPSGRVVAVTFDDAYRSVLEHAFPVLAAVGMPGSVYPVTDLVDSGEPMSWPGVEALVGGPAADEMTGMGWSGLRRLADAGWEVGSHTCRHPWLPDCADDRLRDELQRSRGTIEERLDRRCDTLAYPYGGVDPRVLTAARAAGYEAGGAIASHRAGDPLDHSRVGVYGFDSDVRLRLKTLGPARRVRARLFRGDPWPRPQAAWRVQAGDRS